jgi:demethoxyubiquinone hydroxylase (CLK1/Coq7/Cat5 family)
MDLVAACRVFVHVGERGSFTLGAAAALTESRVPAAVQPAAEAVMAQVARTLHDHLRSLTWARGD